MATPALSTSQQKAIVALLAEPTIKQAAEAAAVGERTLHRWLSEPEFAAAYRQARREATGQAVAQLQKAAGGAAVILASIAEDKANPPAARVSAARAILDYAVRAIELEDISARLEALEAQLASTPPTLSD